MAASLQLAIFMSAAIALGFAGVQAGAAQLCSEYYDRTCPVVHRVARRVLKKAHESDVRIYASLTRLHFHDCFVQGCDGSILLDNSSSIASEKFATPNNNSARGYPVVDAVKAALEEVCPGVVSCADILAIAAKISVQLSGGPRWRVPLGRRDGTTANNLPSPFDNLTTLQQKFGAVGLDDTGHRPCRPLRGAYVRARAVPVRDGAAVQLQRHEPAGPDAGQGVPGVPLPAVPEGRRQRVGAQRPRPGHAGHLRQRLLHQHRGAPRDAAVRPGAAVDALRAHGADRPPLRRQPEGVLQELRQVHDQHGEHPGADGEPG
ncbi:Peroxidase 53 [Zea mays]|uniref:Peroxidase n=1 Tax=Zea mays TaxID=4577 RepID=K7VNV5_MAIZE|nr:Peroxidase 53 [Zea mays]